MNLQSRTTVTAINTSTSLFNSKANWSYEIDPRAVSSTLIVKDEKGRSVLEKTGGTGAGLHNFTWDGLDGTGAQLPDGVYSLSVAGLDRNDKPVGTKVFTKGKVTSIDTSSNDPLLMIGDVKIRLRDVLTVTEPSPTASNAAAGIVQEGAS